MKVLVIGATGAVGLPLVSQLVRRGHEVVGTSRTQERAETLRKLRAEPAVLDLLDREAVRRLVLETRPDAIAHEATALADGVDFKRFAEGLTPTNRLRTEGTENILAAAKEADVKRFVAQSYGVMTYARDGGPVKTEDDPLDEFLPDAMQATIEAVKHNEAAVLDAGGVALRYGSFYGAAIDAMRDAVRERKVPIVGGGEGVWSLIHVATRQERPCWRSSEAGPVCTTSRTTSLHRCARYSPPWQRHSVPGLRERCRSGSRSCSRERSASSS
jgi:nucleoside-diphosphate-sugar epimerase